MIDLARQYNRQGDRCRYHVNAADDLRCFAGESFDFVYSNIVLQHIEPRYTRKYITEFVRLLTREGLAVFQVPGFYRPVQPLDSVDHRASIVVESPTTPIMRLEPGEVATLEVRVRNESTSVWPAVASPHPDICLGNHWLKRRGTNFRFDDGRAGLHQPLEPGQETRLVLQVTAPKVCGRYTLELDMVEEGQAWFAQHGSSTARIPTIVRWSSLPLLGNPFRRQRRVLGTLASSTQDLDPVMELHCVPPDEVRDLVTSAGGYLVDVHAFNVVGAGWESYRYVVARSITGASSTRGS